MKVTTCDWYQNSNQIYPQVPLTTHHADTGGRFGANAALSIMEGNLDDEVSDEELEEPESTLPILENSF